MKAKSTHQYSTILISLFCFMIPILTPAIPIPDTLPIDYQFEALYFEKLADAYYESREIPNHLENAIRFYRKSIEVNSNKNHAYWKITRCYWILASTRTAGRQKRFQLYETGMKFGNRGIQETPDESNAFLWNALIHGHHSLERGVMNAIYTRHKLREWLDKALEIDPKNINAMLGLAGWYFYVPEFFGGNKQETFSIIEQAKQISPNYTAIFLREAEHFLDMNDYHNAKTSLQKLIEIQKPLLPNEGIEDKAAAKRLLVEIETNS